MADMTERADLIEPFLYAAGWGDAHRTLLAGDASNRRYDRLIRSTGETAILMDAPPDRGEDVRPFIRIADHLRHAGLSAPEILRTDSQNGLLVIEDMGDGLFARLMMQNPERAPDLYRAAVDVLIALHDVPPLALPLCDADWLTEASAPAFEWYTTGTDTAAFANFRSVFRPRAAALDTVEKVITLRDYHAENLLWLDQRPGVAAVGLLDFQDALLGHPAYDLVSILQDARRDVSPEIEAQMIAHYIDKSGIEAEEFQSAYAVLGAQRNLRILGIFARLCLRDGKAQYVDLIPRVWGHLTRNLQHPDLGKIAQVIAETLPAPTPEFLEHLKSQCATTPTPS